MNCKCKAVIENERIGIENKRILFENARILTEKCRARSRVQLTKMKMYEKLASKTKKIYKGMPRMDDFPEKKIKKNVEDRPINNNFYVSS